MAEMQEATRMVRVMMRDGNFFDFPVNMPQFALSQFMMHWKSTEYMCVDDLGVGLRWSEMAWCRVMYNVQNVVEEKPKLQ